MDLNTVLAFITGGIAWILLFISYWKNGNNKLLYLQLLSSLFFAINYGILGALSGILVVIFEMIRDYLYTKVKDPNKVFLISLPAYLFIAITGYEGFLSIFSVLASVCDAYALTKKNRKVIILGIITYSLWLVYDIKYDSFGTLIVETGLIISNIIALIRYRYAYLNSHKLKFSRGLIINKKIVNTLYDLNISNFDSNYNWSKEYLNKVIKNNKTELVLISDDDDKVIGYIQFLKINKSKFKDIEKDEKFNKIKLEDIKKFNLNKSNYLYIYGIAIELSYQNKKTINLVSNIIKNYIKKKNKQGYIIKGIISCAASEFENDIYNNLGFTNIDTEVDRDYTYILVDDKLDKLLNDNNYIIINH